MTSLQDSMPVDPMNATFSRIFSRLASTIGDHPAIVVSRREVVTHADLHARLEESIAMLRDLGIGPDDRVGLLLPNGPEMAIMLLATISSAVAAPINPMCRAAELEFVVADLGLAAVVCDVSIPSSIAAAGRTGARVIGLEREGRGAWFRLRPIGGWSRAAADADTECLTGETALVLHTSGTTSRPKIVPLTRGNIITSGQSIARALELRPSDRCLNVMPLFHVHGIINALVASLISGGSIICEPGFDAAKFAARLVELAPSWYSAVPTIHRSVATYLERHRGICDGHRLRFIRSSSASLGSRLQAELEELLGAPVIEAYGMTEVESIASGPLPPRQRRPGTVGIPAGPTVAIMGEHGRILPPGEVGEIVVRGGGMMHGYENDPEANARAFVNGYFRTGDQGMMDRDGYLTITGRLKELIVRGGEKISPYEVEEALKAHPSVAEAVAFPMPHPRLGEIVAAAVVAADGATPTAAELSDVVAARLSYFKVPRTILVLDELPKGPTGKLQRIGLAERLGLTSPHGATASGATASGATASGATVPTCLEDMASADAVSPDEGSEDATMEAWLMELLREPLGGRSVAIEDEFLEIGLDSIRMVESVAILERELGVALSPILLFEHGSVGALARHLRSAHRRACDRVLGTDVVEPAADNSATDDSAADDSVADDSVADDSVADDSVAGEARRLLREIRDLIGRLDRVVGSLDRHVRGS